LHAVSHLEEALLAWGEWKRDRTLLAQYPPGDGVVAPLAAAIETCESFKRVQGRCLFSGNSGVVLHAPSLSVPLLYRSDRADLGAQAVPDAADWLIRMLGTQQANGVFIVAVWGLSIDREIEIAKDMTLHPFDQLADVPMKRRLVERVEKAWDGAVWTSQRHFDAPGAAIVRKVPDFPYIGRFDKSLERIHEIEQDVITPLSFLQAGAAGQPLAVGGWFEYEDPDLDLNSHENYMSWLLPEIVPRVQSNVMVDSTILQRDATALWSLSRDWRSNLLRSMKRFTLSQCRHEIVDQALDLAIAFEIAVSNKGDNAPVSWKVGVRSTQLIGGTLERRQQNRRALADLYKLRNESGSSLKGVGKAVFWVGMGSDRSGSSLL
jgi:hypothetical protein